MPPQDLDRLATERDNIRDRHLLSRPERPLTAARGVHHVALVASDVQQTVDFYAGLLEVLGGLHHIAISVEPGTWQRLKGNLDAAGVDYLLESEVSIYFRDPDGARLELLADPLGEMYGNEVG